MIHRVSADKRSYTFAAGLEPAAVVRNEDEIIFETVDARGGRAMGEGDNYVVPPPPPYERLNPVTGPVAIEGLNEGDVLAVRILSITLGSKGYTAIRTDQGVLKDLVGVSDVVVTSVKDGRIDFGESISLRVRPMVGTIGVAPLGGAIPAVHPGAHGGNIDCNDITVGSTVYLPVYSKGGSFALGDVHASMGDGETSGAGLDIGADVKVRVGVLRALSLDGPMVETDSHITLVYNSKRVEDAVRGVLLRAASLLRRTRGLSTERAIGLISVCGDLGFCQAAMSPIDTVVRVRIPKDVARVHEIGFVKTT